MTHNEYMFRRFRLNRKQDISGVSGTGNVCNGCVFPDGTAVIRWNSDTASTGIFRSIEDLIAVHGHEGATSVEWLDDSDPATDAMAETRIKFQPHSIQMLNRETQ